MRVLLVEDDDELREGLRLLLEEHIPGAEVRAEATALAALRALEGGPYDAMLSDVKLERADDGWRLAARAAELGIPALLMSGDVGVSARGPLAPIPLLSKCEISGTLLADAITCAVATQSPRPHAAGSRAA